LLGVSLKVVAPTGRYDPTKLVNGGPAPEFRRGRRIVARLPAAAWPLGFQRGRFYRLRNAERVQHSKNDGCPFRVGLSLIFLFVLDEHVPTSFQIDVVGLQAAGVDVSRRESTVPVYPP
jgi:hypothetical protein